MKTKQLGNTKLKISEIGLGCMGMSEFYGKTNENDSLQTLQRALQLGINFFDTADVYGMGANEELLARAFKQQWNKIILATKFGLVRDPHSAEWKGVLGSAQYVKKACDASLKRLNIDVIDLYYLHRVDTTVPIEETIGAMADLVRVGKVRYLGLSEANATTIQKAHQIYPITALQSEYSLWTRDVENEILPLCENLNISFIAYSPLGRGFLTSKLTSPDHFEPNDFRLRNPRFHVDNFAKNQLLIEKLRALAEKKGCSPAQLSLAWVLSKSTRIVPIPGTKRLQYLEENVGAAEVYLSEEEKGELEDIFKPQAIAGARYSPDIMKRVGK